MSLTRESVVKYLYDESWLKVGKAVFKTNCVSCHARDGGGLVGPNLTDEEYKNVKDIGDILNVIQNGANGGAMPAWKNRLSPNEMVLVSSYAASLRGTTPAEPKAPEGRPIPAWPEPPAEEEASGDDVSGDKTSDSGAPDAGGADSDADDQPAAEASGASETPEP